MINTAFYSFVRGAELTAWRKEDGLFVFRIQSGPEFLSVEVYPDNAKELSEFLTRQPHSLFDGDAAEKKRLFTEGRIATGIIETVSAYFHITVDEMLGRGKAQKYRHPRCVCCLLLTEFTYLKISEIARIFHRQYNTVVHAIKSLMKVAEDRRYEQECQKQLYILRELLQSRLHVQRISSIVEGEMRED